jgi:hypothetical protein
MDYRNAEVELVPSVNHTQFMELYAGFLTLMRSYFVEVEKSSTMLRECRAEPLPLKERLALTSQGIIEQEAHFRYLDARSVLLDLARRGYGIQ